MGGPAVSGADMKTTSDDGVDLLIREEGEVLRAYRDIVGVLTIGVGLTAASGVVTPKPGMVITRAESRALLARALARNYEPRVNRAMPTALQHEFDAGVSFDFNTGAIHRASWVGHWAALRWGLAEAAFKQWRKAGGRVVRGLVHRRDREWNLLRHGVYGGAAERPVYQHTLAQFVVNLPDADQAEVAKALRELGYGYGYGLGVLPIPRDVVDAFQRDHDLTVDGLIGIATLSTLQRRLDAARKAKVTAAAAAPVAGGAALEASPNDAFAALLPEWALWAGLAVVGLIALRLAWSYRDVVAVKVAPAAPKLAQKLRSI